VAYTTGFDAVNSVVEKSVSAQSPSNVAHPIEPRALWNLGWKDGESHLVRFLSDRLLKIQMHTYVLAKDGSRKDFVCTKHLDGELARPCWICDNMTQNIVTRKGDKITIPYKSSERVLAIAVLRKANKDGKIVDETRPMKLSPNPAKPDETIDAEVPKISIINQGQNFWEKLRGYMNKYNTFLDRDYDIKREGKGLDTAYYPVPEDIDDDYRHFTKADRLEGTVSKEVSAALWEHYGLPESAGTGDPVFDSLIAWMEYRGTEDWFKRWLPIDEQAAETVPDSDDEAPFDDDKPVSKSSSGTRFGALKDLVKDYA
jgi:hypothetical protein